MKWHNLCDKLLCTWKAVSGSYCEDEPNVCSYFFPSFLKLLLFWQNCINSLRFASPLYSHEYVINNKVICLGISTFLFPYWSCILLCSLVCHLTKKQVIGNEWKGLWQSFIPISPFSNWETWISNCLIIFFALNCVISASLVVCEFLKNRNHACLSV